MVPHSRRSAAQPLPSSVVFGEVQVIQIPLLVAAALNATPQQRTAAAVAVKATRILLALREEEGGRGEGLVLLSLTGPSQGRPKDRQPPRTRTPP